MIRFDPINVIRGIEFHAIELRLVVALDPDSVTMTLNRLRLNILQPVVASQVWSQLTSTQKLNFLLEKTGTVIAIEGNDVGHLEEKK